jgi:hypothetical protein
MGALYAANVTIGECDLHGDYIEEVKGSRSGHRKFRTTTIIKTLFLSTVNFRFLSLRTLIQHIKASHNKTIHDQQHEFENFTAFMHWKQEEEYRTNSFYVQHRAPCTSTEAKVWYFYCNRSGKYQSKGDGQRTLKTQGSSKLGMFCSAHMRVMQKLSSEKVSVEYCCTHYNHEPDKDIAHLRMPEQLRLSIAAKLTQGVTFEKILDDIRDSVGAKGLQREHLTSRQDMRNIMRQYNIEGIEKHPNDHTSVSAWVHEMQSMEFDPVIVFKQQGVASEEPNILESDFLLGLQTQFQLDMMKAFGNNVICLDATHGTNLYDFLLVTVMVIDDFGEGIPVGWAITSREDTSMLTYFLKALRERAGPLKPTVFMSDDAQQYWNSWSAVFGDNGTRKLLCTWHIDRAWRNALKEQILTNQTRVELYHHMRVLLMEQDVATFRVMMQQFLSMLVTSNPEFLAYFQKQYVPRAEQWAACHRKCMFINTNMYVESFHRLLKVVYLESKQNRRLDRLLNVLLKIARDKAFGQFQKLHKGKNTHRIAEIRKRHQRANEMVTGGCIPVQLSEQSWKVKHYIVGIQVQSQYCDCKLRCSTCNACIHMYSCSCVDSAIHTTVCKHMHTVQMVRNGDIYQETNIPVQDISVSPELQQHNGQSLGTNQTQIQEQHRGIAPSQASGLQCIDHVLTQEIDVEAPSQLSGILVGDQVLGSNQVESNTAETTVVQQTASESIAMGQSYHQLTTSQQEQQLALSRVHDDCYLGEVLQSTSKYSQLDEKKSKALNKLSELQACITSTHSTEALNAAMKHVCSAVSVLKALNEAAPVIPTACRSKRPAPNALHEKQMVYHSTKKKRSKAQRWAKPSNEEAAKCKEILENVEIRLCAVCFKEDDTAPTQNQVEWVQCSSCNVWIHVSCIQHSVDLSNYICDLCM